MEGNASEVIQAMQHWLEKAVIGLNLCPFAKSVHVKGQIHYAVSRATSRQELLSDLELELNALVACDATARDTTLLIAPDVFPEFLDFADFLRACDKCLRKLDMVGTIQIASFHPQFQFAGTDVDDVANNTNRAPYPVLHLLREDSIAKAVKVFPDAEQIYERNIATLRELGSEGWGKLQVDSPAAGRGKIAP